MKIIFIFLLAIISISTTFAQKDKRLKGIEDELNAILETTKAPGFAVAVVEGDKIIYAKGFGYKDYENKIPVDANTLFAIGSASKAFTSAILGQLRSEDKLSFDDSPIEYIPELSFYSDEMNNMIIIQDLMSHRTGLPRHDYSWYLFPTYDKDSLLLRIPFQEPFTGVRQQWYYNNFMFLTQGVIAERITGKSWEENIRERFFQPLEMNRSDCSIEELELSSNAAIGYVLKNDSIIEKTDYYRIAGMAPAGSINSSVNDMSNWLITWINGGKFKGEEILPESYINEAITSKATLSSGMVARINRYDEHPQMHLVNYGYAWFLSSYKGHYKVMHGGNIDGFSALAGFFPADSIGIVVLSNQGGSAVPTLVFNTMADRMLQTERTDWVNSYVEVKEKAKKNREESEANKESSKIENTRPSHILQDYIGKYSNPGYGEFNIENKNDSLFAEFQLKTLYLKHVHYDIFEPFEVTETGIDTTDTGSLMFNFETNDVGEISLVKMKFEQAIDDPIEFKHEPTTIDVDQAIMESYIGDYELSGTEVKVYLKNGDKLYLFVAGQPEYELVATAKHKFSFKTLEGFKVEFIESEAGTFDDVKIRQPNGTFTAKRK